MTGSTYNWEVDPNGGRIDTIYGGGDSIDIEWFTLPGNYLITLSEYSSAGCASSPSYYYVSVIAPQAFNMAQEMDICIGQTAYLTADTGFVAYLWEDGTPGRFFSTSQAGYHKIRVTDRNGCVNTDSIRVVINNPPTVQIVSNEADIVNASFGLCADSIALGISSTSALSSVRWNNQTEGETYYARNVNEYVSVEVTDILGCTGSDSVHVDVCSDNENLFIPNAIIPASTEGHHIWRPEVLLRYPNCTVQIFDRWGRLIYKTRDLYNNPWDGTYNGKQLPMDAYFYIIDLGNGTEPITGNVNLLR
jgi:gliding motility-associated-like protein